MLIGGFVRRSRLGLAIGAVGGWLVWRAVSGPSGGHRPLDPAVEPGDGSPERPRHPTGVEVSRSVIVGEQADELAAAWRDPEQLSQIFGHVAEVTENGQDQLRWTVHGPLGRDFSVDTRVIPDESGEIIQWVPVADTWWRGAATVRFRPAAGDRGTTVTLTVQFDPPGGRLGQVTLERFDVLLDPVVGRALGRFKSLAETGEIPTLAANPSARGAGDRV